MLSTGRHGLCKKPGLTTVPKQTGQSSKIVSASTMIPKRNYLTSQSSKIIETKDKRIEELSKNLDDLKKVVQSKDEQLNQQSEALEVQRKEIEITRDSSAELRIELKCKGEQLEEMSRNVAILQTELSLKNKQVDQQQAASDVQQKQIESM